MKPEEFFEALSDIDENMVNKAKPFNDEEEAVEPVIVTANKRGFRPFYAAAACIGVLAVGAAVALGIGLNRVNDVPLSTEIEDTEFGDSGEPYRYQYPDCANFIYTGDFSELEMHYPDRDYYAASYNNYSELAEDSDLVVAGTFVDDTKQTDLELIDVDKGIYVSFNKLKVTKVLKGDVKAGDVLTIADSYAVYDGGLYSETLLTPMIKGDSWIYFLKSYENITNDLYCDFLKEGYITVGTEEGRYPVPFNENKEFPYVENENGVVTPGGAFNQKIYDEIKALFQYDLSFATEYSQNYVYAFTGSYNDLAEFSRPKNLLEKHYASYEELAADSDLIVHGVFTDDPHQDVDPNSPPDIPLGTNIFSQCKFKVYDVIKGYVNQGDTIIISQPVGVYRDKYISTSQLSPMVKGDEWFYFLKKDSSGIYYAVNDSDGRYPPLYCSTNFPCEILGYDNHNGYTYKEYFNEEIYSELVKVYEGQTQGDHPQTGCHRIFDAIADKKDYSTDRITFAMGECPDVEFARSVDVNGTQYVEAVYNGETKRLFDGLPVDNIYLYDLNWDGDREICATVSIGSGIIDQRVMVCECSGYPNYTVYELSDRGNYDFVLKQQDDILMVSKFKYNDYGASEISSEPLTLGMMKRLSDSTSTGEQTAVSESTTVAETEAPASDTQIISFDKDMGNYHICADIEAVKCRHGRNCYDLTQSNNNICIKDANGNIVASKPFPWEMNVIPEADSTDLTFDVLEFDGGNMLAMGFPVNVNGTQCRRMSFFCFDDTSVSFAGIGDNYNFDETNPVIRGDLRCENNCICFSALNSDGTGFADCHYLTDFEHGCFSHCEGGGSAHHGGGHHAAQTTYSHHSQGHHSDNHH